MRTRRALAALAAVAVALTSGCGDSEPPLRIGVVVDCVGINRSLRDAELSGAQLPLIERGARQRGRRAADGLDPVEIAGRKVELVPGCSEVGEFSTLTTEVRRMAELEHADAVVAGGGGADQIVLREVAKLYPRTAFLGAVHGPREATLGSGRPISSASRRTRARAWRAWPPTPTGRSAGAGRRSCSPHWDAGWDARDAFAAEFCALGGRVTSQVGVELFDPTGGDVDKVPADVDGVAVFAARFFGPEEFLKRLPGRVGDPARRIVLGPGLMGDPALLRTVGAPLHGATGSTYDRPALMRAYLRRYAEAFPGTSRDVASGELVAGYRDAVEAIVRALERAGGDRGRLRAELARLRPELLAGRVRLDENGQAVAAPTLVRLTGEGRRRADRRAAGGGPVARRPAAGLALPGQPPGGVPVRP